VTGQAAGAVPSYDPAPPPPGESPRAPAQAATRAKAPVRIDHAKRLYTRLINFSLPWDNYHIYCHKRYSVTSLAELMDDQFKEQTKLLDSLKRPERLEAFREVLGGHNGESQGQAQAAAVQ